MSQSIPKISIVTPSFSQGKFLEETILSVLSQNYPNLEYIVIDGGSEDNSIEIIHKYQNKLAYWVSEPDQGQYDAINKGFAKSTGDIMAWINSDDMYTHWAFHVVNDIFSTLPNVEWLTTLSPLVFNASGVPTSCYQSGGYTHQGFLRGENVPQPQLFTLGAIQQESVFWRRSLWERSGACLDINYSLAADFELWARFFQFADLYTVSVPLGGFRFYGNQRSVTQADQYYREVQNILAVYGGRTLGKLEAITTKFIKSYLRLPYSLRQWISARGLKPIHKHCFYNPSTQQWQVKDL